MEVTRMWWLFLLGLMLGGTVGIVVMQCRYGKGACDVR